MAKHADVIVSHSANVLEMLCMIKSKSSLILLIITQLIAMKMLLPSILFSILVLLSVVMVGISIIINIAHNADKIKHKSNTINEFDKKL